MRLGIFGGTFDPVHIGHLLVAEQCLEQCRLDQVWFIPAGILPHKLSQTIAPGKARAEMLELAVAGHERFRVDRRELERADPCYTVETLSSLHTEDPSRELFFVLGGDSLVDFPTWREPKRIAEFGASGRRQPRRRSSSRPQSLAADSGDLVESRVEFVTIPPASTSPRATSAAASATAGASAT